MLLKLYCDTGGPNWTNRTNWGNAVLDGTWHSVTTDSNGVSAIDLSVNNLSGTIPAELGSLTDLGVLNLGRNQLSGMVPTYLGNLTEGLYLNSNQLTGTIPAELGDLTRLSALRLDYNSNLSGGLPLELTNMTSLATLNVKCTMVDVPSDSAFETWLTGLTSYTPATACNPVTVTLAGPGGDVRAGSTKQITLTLSRGLVSGEVLTVQLLFAGPARPGTDYTLSGASAKGVSYNNPADATQITFTGPETEETATVARITFTARDDADTASELVDIGLGIHSQMGLGGISFITVTDNLADFDITVFSPPPPPPPPTVPLEVFVMEEDSEPPAVGEVSSGGCSVVSGEAEKNGPLGAAFSLLLIISCILAASGRKRAWLGRRLNLEARSP